MSTPTPAARYPHPPRTWSRTWHRLPVALRLPVLHLLAWIAVCAVGTQGQLRLLPKWCLEYLPMMLLSAALGLALLRHPALCERRRHVLAVFLAVVLLFQPLQWLYVAWIRNDGFGHGLAGIAGVVNRMRRYGWLTSAGTVAAMVAIGNWRQALTARARDSVTPAEELQFVRDYPALQRLRYGGRLQVRIDGAALLFKISNPVSAGKPPNPGAVDGRFVATVRLPLADAD